MDLSYNEPSYFCGYRNRKGSGELAFQAAAQTRVAPGVRRNTERGKMRSFFGRWGRDNSGDEDRERERSRDAGRDREKEREQEREAVRAYVRERDERRSEERLVALLEMVRPTAMAVVRQRFTLQRMENPAEAEEDANGVVTDALTKLCEVLREARDERNVDRVRSLTPYTNQLVVEAFGDYLDRRYPDRRRLKQRLRHLLANDSQLARWTLAKVAIGGLAPWSGKPPAESDRWTRLQDDPQSIYDTELSDAAPVRSQERSVVLALFRWVNHPAVLDTLTTVMVKILGLNLRVASLDDPMITGGSGNNAEGLGAQLVALGLGPDATAEERERLRTVWKAIASLPVKERLVLLLGLGRTRADRGARSAGRETKQGESGEGEGTANPDFWLPDALYAEDLVTLKELADALNRSVEEFVALHNRLPLSDAEIAQDMDITANYVAVLRKAARDRLGRMDLWLPEPDPEEPDPKSRKPDPKFGGPNSGSVGKG